MKLFGTKTQRLFRGRSADYWQQELEELGWPRRLAAQTALVLVSDSGSFPRWLDFVNAFREPVD